jgi:hypothetical protein
VSCLLNQLAVRWQHINKLAPFQIRGGGLLVPRLLAMPARIRSILKAAQLALGSGLTNQSQKITAAAMHMLEKKVWAQRSYRV